MKIMNILSRLFRSFMGTNKLPQLSYNDEKPKLQKNNAALCGMNTAYGSVKVPIRFYKPYEKALKKEFDGKELTKQEKTILYGYMNPLCHAATSPKKRIH